MQFRKDVAERLDRIDKSVLPGKLKLWCLLFGLFPRLMWPLSVYEIPLSVAEKMERFFSFYVWMCVTCKQVSPCELGNLGNPILAHRLSYV